MRAKVSPSDTSSPDANSPGTKVRQKKRRTHRDMQRTERDNGSGSSLLSSNSGDGSGASRGGAMRSLAPALEC